jgi:hypothetical protein
MFPDLSSIRLHEMICHFYASACERVDDTQATLAQTLLKDYGREFEALLAVSAAHDVQRLLLAPDGSQAALDAILQVIRDELDLVGGEDPLKAYVPFVQYSDTHEEHQVVVLLAATMLEKLFDQLLTRVFVRSGKDSENARKAVKAIRGHPNREKLFAELTGVGFEEAILKSGTAHFHSSWQEIRVVRNKFMHELPFAIHASHAEKAFGLAREAFRVFAQLHNQLL